MIHNITTENEEYLSESRVERLAPRIFSDSHGHHSLFLLTNGASRLSLGSIHPVLGLRPVDFSHRLTQATLHRALQIRKRSIPGAIAVGALGDYGLGTDQPVRISIGLEDAKQDFDQHKKLLPLIQFLDGGWTANGWKNGRRCSHGLDPLCPRRELRFERVGDTLVLLGISC